MVDRKVDPTEQELGTGTKSVDLQEQRKRLYKALRRDLIGPEDSADWVADEPFLIGISPLDRFSTGILFPIVKGESGIDPSTDEAEEDCEDDQSEVINESPNGPVAKTFRKGPRYTPPSSVGFSFFVRGQEVAIRVEPLAVRYDDKDYGGPPREPDGRFARRGWHRIPMVGLQDRAHMFNPPRPGGQPLNRQNVFEDRAEMQVLWRPFSDGWLTTVSLSNVQKLKDEGRPKEWANERNKLCFFEVALRCFIEKGEVGGYPRVDPLLLTEEDQELELQYKHKRIFAIGHGAAVDWDVKNGSAKEIWADFFPKVEVPQVTADVAGAETWILEIGRLACCGHLDETILAGLETFVESYTDWICMQRNEAEGLPYHEQIAAGRIIARMAQAVDRMHQGVQTLRQDPLAAKAFGMANAAMQRQMVQYDLCTGKPERIHRWRPFQLAFLLVVLESAINEDSNFRDILDLIWFPTGGGKTEAYLGLIAFSVVWRRLKFPTSGHGVTALMRYTLRLLTRQQFERATRLIFALELMRREHAELGSQPVTVGVWVGGDSTPNTFEKAFAMVEQAKMADQGPPQPLVLRFCPWCRTPFHASENCVSKPDRFHFLCSNPSCAFYGLDEGRPLPCNVVDEALYESPPTLLIATIDKFARLAWEERASVFFGINGCRPPELIIQDELHLIAGELGSVAGVYESAVDTVLTCRGVRPKYIASTATIRMAGQQVERLYGRPVAVFPPPGISSEDSFFARSVPLNKRPGRLYVGYLAPNLNRSKCMAPLAGALLVAPENLFMEQQDREALLDAWWTLIVYHGSLNGVGISHNAFSTDVPDYMARYKGAWENEYPLEGANRDESKYTERSLNVAELTSVPGPEENSRTFDRLEKRRSDVECLDAVLATNMISVGLDVARMALMIINGQPLTTAEYIQASSRVGRGDVPGLVIANYYRDQARSLSHYESFRPYHESFYRFVEPSSVTPYTYQTRLRALHAALVIAIRHACPRLADNNKPGEFDPETPDVKKIIAELTRRCIVADQDRAGEIAKHLHQIAAQWQEEAIRCRENKVQLVYQSSDRNRGPARLLYNHEARIKGLWPTLQSMRHVENTTLLKPL